MSARKKISAETDERLRGLVFSEALEGEIVKTTAIEEVPYDKVICSFSFTPDHRAVRYHYDEEEIERWAKNDIGPNGIHSPLWVRPHPTQEGKYELIAGLRRYKAAGILSLPTVPVKVFQWDDATAFKASVAENANRKDFNALEELDNTLRLLEMELQKTPEEVVSLLYRMNNSTKRMNQYGLVQDEVDAVKRVFDRYGQVTWQSFVAVRLPLLKLPQDVLQAIRSGALSYWKGIAVAKQKDDVERSVLLNEAKHGLSLPEIRARVNEKKEKSKEGDGDGPGLARLILKEAARPKSWKNPEKAKRLSELLEEIRDILQQ